MPGKSLKIRSQFLTTKKPVVTEMTVLMVTIHVADECFLGKKLE